MKNIIYLLAISIIGLHSCAKEMSKKEIRQESAISPNFVDIVSESGLNDFLLNTTNRNWRDLDNFYLGSVKKYQNRPEINNFKCAEIGRAHV